MPFLCGTSKKMRMKYEYDKYNACVFNCLALNSFHRCKAKNSEFNIIKMFVF